MKQVCVYEFLLSLGNAETNITQSPAPAHVKAERLRTINGLRQTFVQYVCTINPPPKKHHGPCSVCCYCGCGNTQRLCECGNGMD